MDDNEQGTEDQVTALEAAVAETEQLEGTEVAGHVEKFEAVHSAMTEALNSIDEV